LAEHLVGDLISAVKLNCGYLDFAVSLALSQPLQSVWCENTQKIALLINLGLVSLIKGEELFIQCVILASF